MKTRRKTKENENHKKALRKAKASAQSYLDIANVMLISIDAKGIITMINKKGCRILGYKKSEIIGKNWFENFLPKRIRKEVKKVSKQILSGKVKSLKYYENPILTKTGKEKLIAWHNTDLKDKNGKIIGHLSSGEDITERRKIENALIESEMKLRTISENAEDALFSKNKELKYTFVNPAAAKMMGITIKEALGKTAEEIFSKKDAATIKKLDNLNLKGKKVDEIREITQGGKTSHLHTVQVPIFDENKNVVGISGVVRDVSNEIKITEQIKDSELKYRTVAENTPDCLKIVDLEGTIIYANKSVVKNHGFKSLSEAIGTKLYEIPPKPIQKQVKKEIARAKKGESLNVEYKLPIGQNEYKYVLRNYTPIKDASGKIKQIQVTCRNISARKKAEEALLKSEKRFRDIAMSSADWIWEVDANGKYIFTAGETEKILGYKPEELIGKSPFDLMPKDEAKRVGQIFQKIIAKKANIVDLESWNTHKNGKKVLLLTNGAPILDQKGNLLGYRGVDKDITKEMETKQALKESEERHRLLYETSSDAIMTLEPPSWNFTSGNHAIVKMFGVKDEEEFTSLPPWKLSPKYQPDGQLSSVKAKKMIMKAMKEGRNFFEWTHKKLHGENFYATVLLNRVKTPNKVFLQARVQDITESKLTAEALKESSERYKIITEKTEHLVYEYNLATNKIEWEGAIKQIFGYTKKFMDENINTNTFTDLVHPKDRLKRFEVIGKAQENCTEYKCEYQIKTKKNDYIYVEDRGVFVSCKNGKACRALGTMSNISERKFVDKMKTEFVSVASHQLRTPLTSLRWSLEELMSEELGKLNSKQKDYLREGWEASSRMNNLVNDLLNVARLESGRLDIMPKPTNIIKLIESVITEQTPVKKDVKKCRMIIKKPKKKLRKVNIDPALIRQVLSNLLSNARKYASIGKGPCLINISLKTEGEHLKISIRDNGIGIPKINQAHIFEKFARAENVKLINTDGTGLGLYISKLIIEASGGKIWVKSKENQGSTFIFTLPINGSKTHEGEKKLA